MRWKQAWEKNERALKSFTAEFKQFVSAHIPAHFVLHFELSPIATQFSSHCGPGDEKPTFWFEQAPVGHSDVVDFSSEDNVQWSTANSESSAFLGTHALC